MDPVIVVGCISCNNDNDNTFIEHKYRLQMKIYI